MYYDYTQSSWYQQGLMEDGVFYTGLYTDSQGRGLTITVASPFKDTDGNIQGVDCADFDITGLYDEMISIDMGEGTFSFAIDADGDIDYRASVYRNDEIGDITLGLNAMLDRLESTLTKLDDTKLHAEEMSALANKDALTGIRNKTAYDKEVQKTEWDLLQGNREFGFAMVDLNFLKKINDTFGHDKGNISIKKLCHLVCITFAHSPVFRIGGDEFVVILKGNDYHNVDSLIAEFNKTLDSYAADNSLEPWEKVSAAIGYALYDNKIDSSVDNVFKRADKAMYERKKTMKAMRD